MGEVADVFGYLLIRVTDMNLDEQRRRKIIMEDPEWLRDQQDKERYLRRRVLVNVYEKFVVEIANKDAAIRLDVQVTKPS